MTNGERVEALLKDIASKKYPGVNFKETSELAAWLLEDSTLRVGCFLFIVETLFSNFTDLFNEMNVKVASNLYGFNIEKMVKKIEAEDNLRDNPLDEFRSESKIKH